jgi:hypothetical protein
MIAGYSSFSLQTAPTDPPHLQSPIGARQRTATYQPGIGDLRSDVAAAARCNHVATGLQRVHVQRVRADPIRTDSANISARGIAAAGRRGVLLRRGRDDQQATHHGSPRPQQDDGRRPRLPLGTAARCGSASHAAAATAGTQPAVAAAFTRLGRRLPLRDAAGQHDAHHRARTGGVPRRRPHPGDPVPPLAVPASAVAHRHRAASLLLCAGAPVGPFDPSHHSELRPWGRSGVGNALWRG